MSNRKPYVREMKRTWWMHKPEFRFYMIREATIVPLIFFILFLLVGLGSLIKGDVAWQHWIHFMSHPIIVIINLIALAGSLFHAYTFFSMMPTVMPIKIKGKTVDPKVIIMGQWGAVAVITLFFLVLAI